MRKILIFIAIIALIIIAALVTRQDATVPEESQPQVAASTFTGTIEAVDTSCFFDGICTVTISGKNVVLAGGMVLSPGQEVGTLQGVESIGDLEAKIGKRTEVYAATDQNGGYTLYGNNQYYVKVLE